MNADQTQSMPHVVWTNPPDGHVDFVNRHWLAWLVGRFASP
ncbi:MAG TPA: hypothetical protein VNN07_00310 [Candidatus Tectomicrobia bacterium]|nr:hypothetical protein [Candidatus Tectomicrobia bacterium]